MEPPMFCPKCGTENADAAQFCRSCGANISLVPQAVSGQLAEQVEAEEGGARCDLRSRRRQGEAVTIERAVRSVFMGVAFIFVAFSVRFWAPGGHAWWFWMFLPAAGLMADGVSTFLRLRERKQRFAQPLGAAPPNSLASPTRAAALSPQQTSDLVRPPSVTEGTTRHLSVPADRKPGDA
jgi:hypothetical protein